MGILGSPQLQYLLQRVGEIWRGVGELYWGKRRGRRGGPIVQVEVSAHAMPNATQTLGGRVLKAI